MTGDLNPKAVEGVLTALLHAKQVRLVQDALKRLEGTQDALDEDFVAHLHRRIAFQKRVDEA